jgi:hypothetical protein
MPCPVPTWFPASSPDSRRPASGGFAPWACSPLRTGLIPEWGGHPSVPSRSFQILRDRREEEVQHLLDSFDDPLSPPRRPGMTTPIPMAPRPLSEWHVPRVTKRTGVREAHLQIMHFHLPTLRRKSWAITNTNDDVLLPRKG